MDRKRDTTADGAARVTRTAWLASFVVPLLLLAILGAAKSAHATVVKESDEIETTIVSGPGEGGTIATPQPVFGFSATANGKPIAEAAEAVYRCSVDGAPYALCANPDQLGPLADGPHSLSVFAQEVSGSFVLGEDTTPAVRNFTVESEVEGEPEEECEEADEECEEETSPFPPDECLLRTARTRVFTYTAHDKVRLVIRYTSLTPAEVAVDYRLAGRKGSLALGQAKQRFGKKGLFRLSENLSHAEMAKVQAAKGFTVTMRIPAAPKYCNQYYSRHLTIKRTVHSQVVWFQSDSIFGTAR